MKRGLVKSVPRAQAGEASAAAADRAVEGIVATVVAGEEAAGIENAIDSISLVSLVKAARVAAFYFGGFLVQISAGYERGK